MVPPQSRTVQTKKQSGLPSEPSLNWLVAGVRFVKWNRRQINAVPVRIADLPSQSARDK
jgi:hypothetical protein